MQEVPDVAEMSEEELQREVRRLSGVIARAYDMALTQMDLPTATILSGTIEDTYLIERYRALFERIREATRELFQAYDEPNAAERFNPVRVINPRLTAARKVLSDLIEGTPWALSTDDTKEL